MRKPAESATILKNKAVLSALPFHDKTDFEEAKHGLIAAIPNFEVKHGERTIWSMKAYDFLKNDEAPDTINPSLYRNAQLNNNHGLFKVMEGVYQLRGFDISNITIIEGDTGLTVIDTLLTVDTARAALALYFDHRPKKDIHTVIYTHSHADHFGGVKGVVSEEDVKSGKVQIIAPQFFMEFAISENVLAGTAMRRRSQFQFGPLLETGERGQIDAGLGKTLSTGMPSLIAPTKLITESFTKLTIDGVEIVFQLTPGTESPSHMNLHFPKLRLTNMADNVCKMMHNLYAIRGAEIRDGQAWAHYINEAIEKFIPNTEILITQHQWATRGKERITHFLEMQRDIYKYIHDQTVRLLNHGLTGLEIANQLKLPPELEQEWSIRGYYGSLSHNAKAVYQKYLGYYDANPANLDPLPPVEHAIKMLEYMGGAKKIISKARKDFKKGEYRFAASMMKEVVFAEPENAEAKDFLADIYEQLGYQAESSTWRNAYLYGAQELRHGMTRFGAENKINRDTMQAISIELLFDLFATRLNPQKAAGKAVIINWNFTESGKHYCLTLKNCVVNTVKGKQAINADVTLNLTREIFDRIIQKELTFPESFASGQATFKGNPARLADLFSSLDEFSPRFNVVIP